MKLLEKYSCIFCKYRKLNKNHDYACMDSWGKDESGYPIGNVIHYQIYTIVKSLNFFHSSKLIIGVLREHIKKKKNIMKQWIRNMEIVV